MIFELCPVCRRELVIVGRGWTMGGVYFVTQQCSVRCQASPGTLAGEAKKEREELIASFRAGKVRRHTVAKSVLRCYLCGEPIELGEPYYSRFDVSCAHLACVEGGA